MLKTPWFRTLQQTIARKLSRGYSTNRRSRRNGISWRLEPLEERIVPANIITVTSAADDLTAGDAFITLREALHAANSNGLQDTVTGSATGDTIQFSSTLIGQTITLIMGDLPINSSLNSALDPLTIEGLGASSLTISGNHVSRLFSVGGVNNVATISGLSLIDGDPGSGNSIGCIANVSTLTINNCMISGNTSDVLGGAIVNSGTLTINYSTISENSATGSAGDGGGIYNLIGSSLTINDSTITGNSADRDGGGIWNAGSLTMNNSTISGNSANGGSGGAIKNQGVEFIRNSTLAGNTAVISGGAIDSVLGFVTISNSTISGNVVDSGSGVGSGGGINNLATLTISSSTICDNSVTGDGGGIFNDPVATATLQSTIVANNAVINGGGPELFGRFLSSYSLIERRLGATFQETVPGSNRYGMDPLLGPLAENGGPTLTHALLVGSPAINRGANLGIFAGSPAPVFDQRGLGFVRATGRADIGAFEVQQKGSYLVRDLDNGANRQVIVVGTPLNDTIAISLVAGKINVAFNGQTQKFASANPNVVGVVVMGNDGNDIITNNLTSIPSILNGGRGDDTLNGSNGAGTHDILLGGEGNDSLFGRGGRDVLIGGDGHDSLLGGAGDDLLIAGATIYDNSPTALNGIRAEWTLPLALYADRVRNLQQGSRGAPGLDLSTVSDGFYDELTGEPGGPGNLEFWFHDQIDLLTGYGVPEVKVLLP